MCRIVRDLFREFSTPTEMVYGERASNLPEHIERGDYKIGKPDKFSYLHQRNVTNAFKNLLREATGLMKFIFQPG